MHKERGGKSAERQGVLSVNPRGFGFVAAVGFEDDLYISEDRIGAAMHGDLVAARVIARSSRGTEGEVLRVLKRANDKVPGTLRRRGRALWLEPDDTRVRGPIVLHPPTAGRLLATDGEDGQAAVARITRFPDEPRETPEGELEVVLGNPGDPNVEVAKILVSESIEEAHPADAVREAEAYGKEVSPNAFAGREDLTHLPLPTIDPEDARDHDDAVWGVREADGSYRVWIAIADVSHYVRPDTALDQAALARGCSIYLPDRAIPMLPRALSSNLCSLLPNVIRLCLCVEARLSASGEVQSYRLMEGFMRSAAKLTYGGVARALGFTDRQPQSAEAEAMVSDLRVLYDLSMQLRAQRMRRGALDFELPEVKIVIDKESGAPTGVEKRSEDPGVKKAYQLIEELMLLANELVARFLTEKGVPAIYRVHGPPDEKKLDRFANMATTLGVEFDMDDAKDPKKLSALLKRVAKLPSKDVFNMLLLRAMKQASYDTHNIGHFGLASTTYLHFTSPIRRYPDLVVHRAVRELLNERPIDKSTGAVESLKMSATMASERERHAMDVEREVVDLYRALYMRAHIGETFTAKVTALVGSGVFAQLDSPFVDVLVRSESLGADRFELDDEGMMMVGVRSGEKISLGDTMEIEIEDVALLRRTVYGRRLWSAVDADAPPFQRPIKKVFGRTDNRGRPTSGRDRPQSKDRPRADTRVVGARPAFGTSRRGDTRAAAPTERRGDARPNSGTSKRGDARPSSGTAPRGDGRPNGGASKRGDARSGGTARHGDARSNDSATGRTDARSSSARNDTRAAAAKPGKRPKKAKKSGASITGLSRPAPRIKAHRSEVKRGSAKGPAKKGKRR